MSQQQAISGLDVSTADLSAVRALAEHLEVTLQDLDEWFQHSQGIPPQVLLSWVCLWDLKRR
jgi:hypothetical protein